ncbi:TetR/AcrR family transcriptional regulator [Micromonospora coerulea]|uniref:TetR/AcrR family transcriptional regulator n=1 Tax=Micromonospora coerulea TaxID=47856 RepID=A0ABP8SRM6_9ACTN
MEREDGRRARGDRTRRRVAIRAAELASVNGLSGLTLGQLADNLQIGKSSVAAVFHTKQELQLAAIAAAGAIFEAAVVAPTSHLPPGLPRLRGLVEAWLRYVSEPVLPGGCFMVATAAEFDSRPGPIRDALAQLRREWIALLTREIEQAQAHGMPSELPAPLLAFEVDALLASANIAYNLLDDPDALDAVRRILGTRLGLTDIGSVSP